MFLLSDGNVILGILSWVVMQFNFNLPFSIKVLPNAIVFHSQVHMGSKNTCPSSVNAFYLFLLWSIVVWRCYSQINILAIMLHFYCILGWFKLFNYLIYSEIKQHYYFWLPYPKWFIFNFSNILVVLYTTSILLRTQPYKMLLLIFMTLLTFFP